MHALYNKSALNVPQIFDVFTCTFILISQVCNFQNVTEFEELNLVQWGMWKTHSHRNIYIIAWLQKGLQGPWQLQPLPSESLQPVKYFVFFRYGLKMVFCSPWGKSGMASAERRRMTSSHSQPALFLIIISEQMLQLQKQEIMRSYQIELKVQLPIATWVCYGKLLQNNWFNLQKILLKLTFIQHQENPEANEMFIIWWMGKQTVAEPYHGIPLSNKEEQIPSPWNTMDESQKPHAKWKKPNSKPYILCDSTNMIFWKRQNCMDGSLISDCQGPRDSRKGLTTKGHERRFWNDGTILCLSCGGGCLTVCIICHNS